MGGVDEQVSAGDPAVLVDGLAPLVAVDVLPDQILQPHQGRAQEQDAAGEAVEEPEDEVVHHGLALLAGLEEAREAEHHAEQHPPSLVSRSRSKDGGRRKKEEERKPEQELRNAKDHSESVALITHTQKKK